MAASRKSLSVAFSCSVLSEFSSVTPSSSSSFTPKLKDADSKLIVSWFVGDREAGSACHFMNDVADRLTNRVQLTTDGHRAYLVAVQNAFDNDIDFAQLVKMYGGSEGNDQERKYSPAVCTGAKKTPITGEPNPKFVSTSYVERQNLTMRMHMKVYKINQWF